MSYHSKAPSAAKADTAAALDLSVPFTRRTPIDVNTAMSWKLDEASGNFANEVVGGQAMTDRTGASVRGITSPVGRGIRVPSGNRVNVVGQGIDPAAGLTVSLWVMLEATPTLAWQHLCRKMDVYNSWTGPIYCVMGWNTDNLSQISGGVYYDSTHAVNGVIKWSWLTLFTWHQLALTIQPLGNAVFYFNGDVVGSGAYPVASVYWGTQSPGATRGEWFFGADPSANAAQPACYADFRVEGVARSATYMKAMYENGRVN